MLRFTAVLTTLAFGFFGASASRAAPIPASNLQWTYNFTPGSPDVISNTSASARVHFSNEDTKPAVGKSDIVATNLQVFSAATAANPDTLTSNGNYSLTLVLGTVDDGTPYSASLTFTGKLSGTFSAESANITNVFGPNAVQVVELGTYKFTVSLLSYTPPGPPDQKNLGSIAATVVVSGGPTPSQDTPEPSTMLLSALGLSCLGGAAWRKKRSKADAC